jgi:hypothetical protein
MMSKFETRQAETAAVKKGLAEDYDGVTVKHGTGSAWGWMRVSITIPRPDNCRCQEENEGQMFPETCRECRNESRLIHDTVEKKVLEITGRTGEYGGCVNYSIHFKEEV